MGGGGVKTEPHIEKITHCPPANESKFSSDPHHNPSKIMASPPLLPIEGILSLLVTSCIEAPHSCKPGSAPVVRARNKL